MIDALATQNTVGEKISVIPNWYNVVNEISDSSLSWECVNITVSYGAPTI